MMKPIVHCLLGVALATLALARAPSWGAVTHCVMSDPTTCSTVNELLLTAGFKDAITRFIGSKRVSYFRDNMPLSWQAWHGLNGPPDERKPLANGLYLFAACPAHDCGGPAAAVVLDGHGAIKGIGFSHFHCGGCEDLRSLDLFVKGDGAADAVTAALRQWGTDSIHTVSPEANERIADRTVIHRVP